jgi:hypothetical protein
MWEIPTVPGDIRRRGLMCGVGGEDPRHHEYWREEKEINHAEETFAYGKRHVDVEAIHAEV